METVVLTCGYCGGRIDLTEDTITSKICTCKYCRSTVLIPKDRTRIENWYNRAIFHRMNGDFDNAIKTYERILADDNSDPEAHWGLALSKNGIEFVDDSKTGDKVPTCHRTREQTILSDPEYNAALDCADESTKKVLKQEAKRIHEIQKKILEISRSESPYDVFISYKELDDTNVRTKDSVLAQDLYSELQKKGYKVFFARKTLETKLGHEYEPIIYAALSSARVMVVLGTSPENFNSAWVRNEWRRFQLMSKDMGKTIIVAYRDMFPDQLPNELSSLTALDMSRIGFLQELVDGVGRCIGDKASDSDEGNEGIGRERLAKNGGTFLALGKIDKAKASFEQMTETYPEDYRGWWGLVECETNQLRDVLPDRINILSGWYLDAYRTAPESKRSELKNKYYGYLRLSSPELAERELCSEKEQIEKKRKEITRLDNQIAKQAEIVELENLAPQQTLEEMEDKIRKEYKEIEKCKQQRAGHTIAVAVSIAFIVLGVILSRIGGYPRDMLALFSIVIGVALFFLTIAGGRPKDNTAANRDRIEEHKRNKAKKDAEATRRLERAQNEMSQKEKEKEQLQDDIKELELHCSKPIQSIAEEVYHQYTARIEEKLLHQ